MPKHCSLPLAAGLAALLALASHAQAQTSPMPAASVPTGDPAANVTNQPRDPKAAPGVRTPGAAMPAPAASRPSTKTNSPAPETQRRPDPAAGGAPAAATQRTPAPTMPAASRPSTKTNSPAPETQRRPDPVPAGSAPSR